MKYFRIVKFQPNSLTELAQNCWLNSLVKVLRSFHIWQKRGGGTSIEEVAEDIDNFELTWHQDIQSIIGFQESSLPCSLQEALYLKGCALFEGHQLLHHDSDLFPYFFQCLWRPLFRCFQLPRYVKDRSQVLNWILEDHSFSNSRSSGPAQLSVQVYQDQYSNPHSSIFPAEYPAVPSLEESYLVKRIVRTISGSLTDLTLWQIMDDVLCQILGQNCLHLKMIDVRKSTKITHFGVRQLLFQIRDNQGQIPTALCQTLREINLSETRLPSFSSLLIIEKCLELTKIYIDQETWTEVWNEIIQQIENSSRTVWKLQILYLPLLSKASNSFHPSIQWPYFLRAFPELKKITVRMDRSYDEKVTRIRPNSLRISYLKEMSLHGCNIEHLTPIMAGTNLQYLTLSDVSSQLQLKVIASYCPSLQTLQVIRSSLILQEKAAFDISFPHLKKVYFFSVNCQSSPLLNILSVAPQLEDVQANIPFDLTDDAITNMLNNSRLFMLKRLIFTSCLCPNRHENNQSQSCLTVNSVLQLFDNCPTLQCLGDSRIWRLSSEDHVQVSRKLKILSENVFLKF